MAGFRKAKAEQAAVKLGMYGPPGSGKTFTALLLAEGLAAQCGKRVAYVDTERGTDFYCKAVPERKFHPQAFDFDALYSRSLSEVLSEVRRLKTSEHGVVVLDSVTHLWEAARAAYEGRTTSVGSIPMHAWGKIKKPYKDLINHLLSSQMHVIFCGRQGTEYENDETTDELRAVGKKMKAEGETAYEPHILIRMEPLKEKSGASIVRAIVEKDRTGILAGHVINWPNFDNVCKPIIGLLGGEQAVMPTEDETAVQDAEALAAEEMARERESNDIVREFAARVNLAKNLEELKVIGKEITPALKKRMLAPHVAELREHYQLREKSLGGGN